MGGQRVPSDIITDGLSSRCPVYLTEPELLVHLLSGLFLPVPTRLPREWRPDARETGEEALPTSCALDQDLPPVRSSDSIRSPRACQRKATVLFGLCRVRTRSG